MNISTIMLAAAITATDAPWLRESLSIISTNDSLPRSVESIDGWLSRKELTIKPTYMQLPTEAAWYTCDLGSHELPCSYEGTNYVVKYVLTGGGIMPAVIDSHFHQSCRAEVWSGTNKVGEVNTYWTDRKCYEDEPCSIVGQVLKASKRPESITNSIAIPQGFATNRFMMLNGVWTNVVTEIDRTNHSRGQIPYLRLLDLLERIIAIMENEQRKSP